MENPKPILGLAASASSVLLAASFVAYRAGAFDSALRSGAPGAHVGNNSSDEPEQAILPSTKVIARAIKVPSSNRPSDRPVASEPPPVFMGGSKSTYMIEINPKLFNPLLEGFGPDKPPATN